MGIVTYEDKQRIIEILRDSFKENQSVNYIVKQDRKRIQRIEKLLEYSLFQGEHFGKIFLSEDQNAACIILFSDHKKTTFKTIQQDLKLVTQVIGFKKVKAALARESLLKQHYPDIPFVHLWYIGVDPEHQKKGIGSKLLKEVIAYCGDRPIYLETSVESNLRWYKKYGFEIVNVVELGYLLYILKKD